MHSWLLVTGKGAQRREYAGTGRLSRFGSREAEVFTV